MTVRVYECMWFMKEGFMSLEFVGAAVFKSRLRGSQQTASSTAPKVWIITSTVILYCNDCTSASCSDLLVTPSCDVVCIVYGVQRQYVRIYRSLRDDISTYIHRLIPGIADR